MDLKEIRIYNISPEELDERLLNLIAKAFPKQELNTDKLLSKDELLTVDETIDFLKCSKQALWNWRKNGILPSYRLGNRVYYKKSDILSKLVKQ